MLISQARSGRPNSAANSPRRPINSAAGRPEYIVCRLLLFLYSWVMEVQFLGVTTRFVPAPREGCIVGGEKDDLKARRAARDRNRTGAGYLNEPERLHQRDESVELFTRSRHLEDEALGRRIDDAGAEDVGETERLDARLAFARDLDQRHFALDKGALIGQVVNLVHRNEARQLRLDLLDDHSRSRGHDGDPRQAVAAIDLGDGQALDIVAAPGKQPDHTRQDARLVVDENGNGMALELGHVQCLKREPCPPPRPASWPRPRGRAASRCAPRRTGSSGSSSPSDRP